MARVSLPLISVIVPTVPGREGHLSRCVRAYTTQAPGNYGLDLVIEHDHATVGLGWQAGAGKARGDFLHLTNDDIEPRPGWHAPAIEAIEQGFLPAPQVYGPDGDPQSWPEPGKAGADWAPVPMSSLPFMSRAQWERITPLLTSHYYSDDFISWRGRLAGWPPALRSGYAFTHHWAQVRRGAGMTEQERMRHDRGLYDEAIRRAARGEWTVPWPASGSGIPA
jgi:hypothetical protein